VSAGGEIALPPNLVAAAAEMGLDVTAWTSRLPVRIADCARRWDLTVHAPLRHDGYTAVVLPAVLADGTAAILKLRFPFEPVFEAEALSLWHGVGACRLGRQCPTQVTSTGFVPVLGPQAVAALAGRPRPRPTLTRVGQPARSPPPP